jgi:hypothetical protein
VDAGKAEAYEPGQLAHSRIEGEFLVSFKTPGGWVGITKDLLTDVVGTGQDAKIVGLPPEAATVLRLMCSNFAVVRDSDGRGSSRAPAASEQQLE